MYIIKLKKEKRIRRRKKESLLLPKKEKEMKNIKQIQKTLPLFSEKLSQDNLN